MAITTAAVGNYVGDSSSDIQEFMAAMSARDVPIRKFHKLYSLYPNWRD
jgi:hypothetical protein